MIVSATFLLALHCANLLFFIYSKSVFQILSLLP